MMRSIGRYLGAYLLGIIAGILFTPADIVLVGQWLILPYVLGAIPGTVYVVYGAIVEAQPLFWFYLLAVGLLPIWVRLYFRLNQKPDTEIPRLMMFRPLWVSFMVGFLGTLGVYVAAMESV